MPQRMKYDDLVEPVHEFRRELAARRFLRGPLDLAVEDLGRFVRWLHEAHAAGHHLGYFAAAQVGRQENHRLRKVHAAVVAQRQRSLIEHAQQQLPQGVGSLFDFVEQQEAQLHLIGVIFGELLLRDQRMRLAVAQVAWRRADQLGDFVRVLELRAVHLDDGAGVPKENLGRGLHDAGLARAGGAQEEQVSHGAARRAHVRAEDLIQVHESADGLFLSDDLLPQSGVKFLRFQAAKRRIELLTGLTGAHGSLLPEIPLSKTSPRSPVELVEFYADRGVQQAQLRHQFMTGGRRLRHVQKRRKKIGQIQIQTAKSS